jgi:hypothetical protein
MKAAPRKANTPQLGYRGWISVQGAKRTWEISDCSDARRWFGGALGWFGPVQSPTNRPRRAQHPPRRRGLLIRQTPGGWGWWRGRGTEG